MSRLLQIRGVRVWGGGLLLGLVAVFYSSPVSAQCVDYGGPTGPAIVGGVLTPGYAQAVAVVGSYAYVADHSGLRVIDVSSPAAPAIVGGVSTPGLAYGVVVAGNYAYVADGYGHHRCCQGLRVINVGNPAAPTIVGSVLVPIEALGVAVVGSYAYVTDDYLGLQVVDVSNPTAPAIVGAVGTGASSGVTVVGSYAYVADLEGRLWVVDISNPTTPAIVGGASTPGSAWGVAVAGDYAYVADGTGGLQIVPAHCNTETAVFLQSFHLAADPGHVTLRWSTTADSDPAEFRVQATAGSHTWDVPVTADADAGLGGGTYVAVDDADALLDGGTVEYSLYYRESVSTEWSVLHSETATMDRVPHFADIASVYPNPFNAETTIDVSLGRPDEVRLSVYDVSGRRVAIVREGRLLQGTSKLAWKARANGGGPLPSGVYFLQLESRGTTQVRKVVVVR
jgi:hypothetical protein